MRVACWLMFFFFTMSLGAAQETQTYIARHSNEFPGPEVYKDPATATLLYVETDGRHVAAISCAGKLLWNRDPHADAHLPFYRTKQPKIVYIGPDTTQLKSPKFVTIVFNNSQFGVMRIRDGEFRFSGQD